MSSSALPTSATLAIDRCAESLGDLDQLRDALWALRMLPGEEAAFATALFDLERAKKGDFDARGQMTEIAAALLGFWSAKTGDGLAQQHPALVELWHGAAELLVSFEMRQFSASLRACWEARGEKERLPSLIDALAPRGNRRVEFAVCLYHLELARMHLSSSRVEFAKRVALVQEAYLDAGLAKMLVGDDPGLASLWHELLPYLDEFFEVMEEQAAKAKRQAEVEAEDEVVTQPNRPSVTAAVGVELSVDLPTQLDTGEFSEINEEISFVELPPPLPRRAAPISRPAPPAVPDDLTPPPGTLWEPDLVEVSEPGSVDDLEILEAEPISVGGEDELEYRPDARTLEFWKFTETTLELLPPLDRPRLGSRALVADARNDRKRLTEYLDQALQRFDGVPVARSFICLLRLYLAAQVKDKTLFGQSNPRRKEAFLGALQLLNADAESAGRAAVWFQMDGPETCAHLFEGLTVVMEFLSYCDQERLDPLNPHVSERFLAAV